MGQESGASLQTSTIPFFVDQASGCFYAVNPETGQRTWIVDYETGEPMKGRELFVDSSTGGVFAKSLSGAGYVWLVDPTTGSVLSQESRQASQDMLQQALQRIQGQSTQAMPQTFGLQQQPSLLEQPLSPQQPLQPEQPMQAEQSEQLLSSQQFMQSEQSEQPLQPQQSMQPEPPLRFQQPEQPLQSQAALQPEQPLQSQAALQPEQPQLSMQDQSPAQSSPAQQMPSAQQDALDTLPSWSGMAVAGFVLSIVALGTSFFPIINIGSVFLAVLGLVFAIVGIVGTGKNKLKKGRGLAIAALILCIVSLGVVICMQYLFGKAVDSVADQLESESTSVSESGSSSSDGEGSTSAGMGEDLSSMVIGQSATLDNGLTIAVIASEFEIPKDDGGTVSAVTVAYVNNGSSDVAFNQLNWKALDEQGELRLMTLDYEAADQLNSGDLAPGESMVGNVYFEGYITKVYFFESMLQTDSDICWELE